MLLGLFLRVIVLSCCSDFAVCLEKSWFCHNTVRIVSKSHGFVTLLGLFLRVMVLSCYYVCFSVFMVLWFYYAYFSESWSCNVKRLVFQSHGLVHNVRLVFQSHVLVMLLSLCNSHGFVMLLGLF